MPTVFTHAFVAGTAGATVYPHHPPRRLFLILVVLSVLPDADSIGFSMGVPYSHPLGHRGFFHSLFFAAVAAGIAAWLFIRAGRLRLFLLFFAVTASHGFLDAMTDGGLGIALFAPFDHGRIFFPFRPIPVAPIGISHFLSPWGARVLLAEILLLWLPVAALAVLVAFMRNGRREGDPTARREDE